jgi:hypothetical protein
MLKAQLWLMCCKVGFQIVFSLNLLYVSATALFYAISQRGQDISTILSPDSVFPLQNATVFFELFMAILPFLIVLVFAFSFLTDQELFMLPAFQSRSGVWNYYLSKAFACFAGVFFVFFFPLFLGMILNLLIFPQSGHTFFGDFFDRNYSSLISGDTVTLPVFNAGMLFPALYLSHPQLYQLLFAFFFSAGMVFLVLSHLPFRFTLKNIKFYCCCLCI